MSKNEEFVTMTVPIRKKEQNNGIQCSAEFPVFLNLAPGGAKGAYQAGALLCLAERGIRFDRVLGSSIGALNGAFYVQGTGSPEEMARLCKIWLSLPEKIPITLIPSIVVKIGEILRRGKTIEDAFVSFFDDVLSGRDGLLGDLPVAGIIDSVIDYRAVCASSKELIIAVMKGLGPLFDLVMAPMRKPEYFSSFKLNEKILRRLLLASASIPVLCRAQELFGIRLVDAGWSRLSLEPLLVGVKPSAIISIEFFRDGPRSYYEAPGVKVIRISPSENIDTSLSSTFNFSRDFILKLMKLGYKDAGKTVETCFDIKVMKLST